MEMGTGESFAAKARLGESASYEDLIRNAPIVLGMQHRVKVDVAARLIDELVAWRQFPAERRDVAFADVHEREVRGGCTALANGIAIPHCRIDDLPRKMLVAIGVHPRGLDCGSYDGLPSKIFILILTSPEAGSEHIHFLAEINRRLLKPEIREHILIATQTEQVRELLLAKV